ncbi:MAG: site-specific integrase [Deltaproteobacteria bacterium]|nr:MAG: site-specific integrase [Deltaproteobacteria bacterium]
MSVYFTKGKGWRYDFTLSGTRQTRAWFETKTKARQAEAERREEILNPKEDPVMETEIDMVFLDLVNLRLDHVKAYNSESHYGTYTYVAKRWTGIWEKVPCSQITTAMVQKHLLKRRQISAYTANKDLRYLRATFRFGIGKRFITNDPTEGLGFFPVEKKVKYVPSATDLDQVIACADPDTQDYLWIIRETMARVGEVNRLKWDDVNFEVGYVVLYTRKKSGGHLTPRKVPMTRKLHEVLSLRFQARDPSKSWVFWHRYWSRKKGDHVEGPYGDRKKIMKTLCTDAKVRYFRFHPIRHSGASIMDGNNVPIGAIQRILGHENRRTTEIYLHSIDDLERDAMAVFEQAREKSHTDSHTGSDPTKKGSPAEPDNPLS